MSDPWGSTAREVRVALDPNSIPLDVANLVDEAWFTEKCCYWFCSTCPRHVHHCTVSNVDQILCPTVERAIRQSQNVTSCQWCRIYCPLMLYRFRKTLAVASKKNPWSTLSLVNKLWDSAAALKLKGRSSKIKDREFQIAEIFGGCQMGGPACWTVGHSRIIFYRGFVGRWSIPLQRMYLFNYRCCPRFLARVLVAHKDDYGNWSDLTIYNP